jgi:hypothetical protein
MADANPVKMGVPRGTSRKRNTARPVRKGLLQDKNVDGTPNYGASEETPSATRVSNVNKKAARRNRTENRDAAKDKAPAP